MKFRNIRKLERLGVFTMIGGLVSILLGFLVIFVDVSKKDFKHIQVGIFIFAIGYSFVQVGKQLSQIAQEERKLQQTG